jgi:hypothetical protein
MMALDLMPRARAADFSCYGRRGARSGHCECPERRAAPGSHRGLGDAGFEKTIRDNAAMTTATTDFD